MDWTSFLGLGLLDGCKPFLCIFLLPWTIRLDGLWAFGTFLGFWTWSAMDKKKGPLQKSCVGVLSPTRRFIYVLFLLRLLLFMKILVNCFYLLSTVGIFFFGINYDYSVKDGSCA